MVFIIITLRCVAVMPRLERQSGARVESLRIHAECMSCWRSAGNRLPLLLADSPVRRLGSDDAVSLAHVLHFIFSFSLLGVRRWPEVVSIERAHAHTHATTQSRAHLSKRSEATCFCSIACCFRSPIFHFCALGCCPSPVFHVQDLVVFAKHKR